MSHMTPVEWKVHDLDLFKEVVQTHGCTISEKGFARYWNGARERCDLTVEVPNSKHDIAMHREGEAYGVAYDSYGSDGRVTHATCGELYADYSQQVAMQAAMLGGMATEVEEEGNLVRITMTEM